MTRTAAQQIDFPLNIWDRVELLVGEGDEQGIYVSRIEDVNSEGIVIVKPDFVTGNRLLPQIALSMFNSLNRTPFTDFPRGYVN